MNITTVSAKMHTARVGLSNLVREHLRRIEQAELELLADWATNLASVLQTELARRRSA